MRIPEYHLKTGIVRVFCSTPFQGNSLHKYFNTKKEAKTDKSFTPSHRYLLVTENVPGENVTVR